MCDGEAKKKIENLLQILKAVADVLTFGALKPCQLCKGQYVFRNSNYICNGNSSEWAKCENVLKEPPRDP